MKSVAAPAMAAAPASAPAAERNIIDSDFEPAGGAERDPDGEREEPQTDEEDDAEEEEEEDDDFGTFGGDDE